MQILATPISLLMESIIVEIVGAFKELVAIIHKKLGPNIDQAKIKELQQHIITMSN